MHGYYTEDPSSSVVKYLFPSLQCSLFFTLESPELPKAQANNTKTQVMRTPRISALRHRLPASQHCKTPGVRFSSQEERAARVAFFAPHGAQCFSYERWWARKSSENAERRTASISAKRLWDFTCYTSSTEACICLMIPGL